MRTLLVARSLKHDKVIGKMLSTAVGAIGQLSGRLPGIVCVHTPEPMNWKRVADAGILEKHLEAVARTTDLSKANAIVFTSAGSEHGAYVLFTNAPGRPLPGRFRVFGLAAERN